MAFDFTDTSGQSAALADILNPPATTPEDWQDRNFRTLMSRPAPPPVQPTDSFDRAVSGFETARTAYDKYLKPYTPLGVIEKTVGQLTPALQEGLRRSQYINVDADGGLPRFSETTPGPGSPPPIIPPGETIPQTVTRGYASLLDAASGAPTARADVAGGLPGQDPLTKVGFAAGHPGMAVGEAVAKPLAELAFDPTTLALGATGELAGAGRAAEAFVGPQTPEAAAAAARAASLGRVAGTAEKGIGASFLGGQLEALPGEVERAKKTIQEHGIASPEGAGAASQTFASALMAGLGAAGAARGLGEKSPTAPPPEANIPPPAEATLERAPEYDAKTAAAVEKGPALQPDIDIAEAKQNIPYEEALQIAKSLGRAPKIGDLVDGLGITPSAAKRFIQRMSAEGADFGPPQQGFLDLKQAAGPGAATDAANALGTALGPDTIRHGSEFTVPVEASTPEAQQGVADAIHADTQDVTATVTDPKTGAVIYRGPALDNDIVYSEKGDFTDAKPQAPTGPQYAYRARNVGEQGITVGPEDHAHASMSEDDVRNVAPSRTDAPQEVVRTDLSKMDPSKYQILPRADGGAPWVKFNDHVPESSLETVGPVTEADQAAASKADEPLREAVLGQDPEELAPKAHLTPEAALKGQEDVRADAMREFSPEAIQVKRAALAEGLPEPGAHKGGLERDVNGNPILPGEEHWTPEQRQAVHETSRAYAKQIGMEESGEPTGKVFVRGDSERGAGHGTVTDVLASTSKKGGTPLEDIAAGPKAITEALERDKGNPLGLEIHKAVARDPQLADHLDATGVGAPPEAGSTDFTFGENEKAAPAPAAPKMGVGTPVTINEGGRTIRGTITRQPVFGKFEVKLEDGRTVARLRKNITIGGSDVNAPTPSGPTGRTPDVERGAGNAPGAARDQAPVLAPDRGAAATGEAARGEGAEGNAPAERPRVQGADENAPGAQGGPGERGEGLDLSRIGQPEEAQVQHEPSVGRVEDQGAGNAADRGVEPVRSGTESQAGGREQGAKSQGDSGLAKAASEYASAKEDANDRDAQQPTVNTDRLEMSSEKKKLLLSIYNGLEERPVQSWEDVDPAVRDILEKKTVEDLMAQGDRPLNQAEMKAARIFEAQELDNTDRAAQNYQDAYGTPAEPMLAARMLEQVGKQQAIAEFMSGKKSEAARILQSLSQVVGSSSLGSAC